MLRSPAGRLFLVLMSATLAAGANGADKRPPNIVLIFADDLGWKDVGYQGTDFYETPNLDKLTREGMVFTHAYAGAGNCAPSRGCLLSGTYTPRHEVYAVGSTDRGPKNLMRMNSVPNKSGLAPANVTIADALKSAGYATGIFGKWHLSGPQGAQPGAQGFDTVMDKNYPQEGVREDPKAVDTITRAACEFMEANRDRPFFAYVPHHAIHGPHQATQPSFDRFEHKTPGAQHKDPLYAACLLELDRAVADLLAKLKELNLEQNTLVVFTSDNGGTQQSSQEPLRGNKGSYYEGGIREPFIVRWPGVVAPGTKCDVPVINIDLFPTFLAAAGVKVPDGKVLDGESLMPLLTQQGPLQREAIFWHFPGYLDEPVIRGRDPVFRTRPVSTIHKGDWKLLLYHEEWQLDGGRDKRESNNALELYDLSTDEGERTNLASQRPEKRDELLGDLLAWFDKVDAKLPTEKNPAYDPNAKPTGQQRRKRANACE